MGRQVTHFGDDLHHRGTKKVDHLERILIEQVNIFLQANQSTIVSLYVLFYSLITIYISYIIYNLIFLQVIQEPVHGMLDGRKSIMCSLNVVGVILLTVAICTVQAGNNNKDYTIRYLLSLFLLIVT